jgi:hypothetical protein
MLLLNMVFDPGFLLLGFPVHCWGMFRTWSSILAVACPTCIAWVSKEWTQVEVLDNFGWIAITQTSQQLKLENLSFNLHFYILKMGHWFTGEANLLSSHPPGFHSRYGLWLCPTYMAWVSKGFGQVEVLGNFGWIATTQTWHLNRMKSSLCGAATEACFLKQFHKKGTRQTKTFSICSGYRGLLNSNNCQMFSIWVSDPGFILLGFPIY